LHPLALPRTTGHFPFYSDRRNKKKYNKMGAAKKGYKNLYSIKKGNEYCQKAV